MQRPEEELIAILRKNNVDFTASLPCEKIKTLLEMVKLSFRHVPLTREEEGVGICAGAALAGKLPALFVQSSGIGNMINALLSLTQFYELPLAIFVSRRGVYKEKIEAQLPMGRKLPGLLSGAGIGYSIVNNSGEFGVVDQELKTVYSENRIHAFLISPEAWEGSECGIPERSGTELHGSCGIKGLKTTAKADPSLNTPHSSPNLTRYDIINIISPYLVGNVVVSNLGWPSKELYAVKHQPSNFYMLGSMGMATPIGLGIALASQKEVIVIDGDGSLLMNPGTLATAAGQAPENLTIIAIDNGVYGSTGNQPTLTGSCVDLEQVARGFGFRNTMKASSEKEISEAMRLPRSGLTFIHVLAAPGNKNVPNLPVDHLEIMKQVRESLRT